MKKLCKILSVLLLVFLLAGAGVFFMPRVLGYQCCAVKTEEMEPSCPKGSLQIVKQVDADSIKKSDLVRFSLTDEGGVTVGRVIENRPEEERLILQKNTRGDEESSVPYSRLLGKVAVQIPLAGSLFLFVQTPYGIVALTGGILLLLFLFFLSEVLPNEEEKAKRKSVR